MTATDHVHTEDKLFEQCLREFLGITDPVQVSRVRAQTIRQHVHAGQYVLRQGDDSDAMYLILSGRLRAQRSRSEGKLLVLNEMGRGELFGEMGVLNQQVRAADVLAIRDSLLLKVQASDVHAWLHEFPQVALHIIQRLITRLSKPVQASRRSRLVNVCILPLHLHFAHEFARELAGCCALALEQESLSTITHFCERPLRSKGRVRIQGADCLPEALRQALANEQARQTPASILPNLVMWLTDQESTCDMQILLADSSDTSWTRSCLSQADLVLLLADSGSNPQLTELERLYFSGSPALFDLRQSLCLVHPAQTHLPLATGPWLHARPYMAGNVREPVALSHHHLRRESRQDMGRLARILCGRSVGLVLSGGGARGFVELGILQAVQEAGLPIDMCGGTSIGAVVGAYTAMDLPALEIQRQAKLAFQRNPIGDFNWLPLVSIMRGNRLRKVIEQAANTAFHYNGGPPPGMEDTWIPFFCVATNYSRVQMQVLRQGSLSHCLTSSVSIPVALPPVIWEGDLLVDGVVFNNYPVDVMRDQGANWILGVNLNADQYRPLALKHIPHPAAIAWDRWMRPFNQQKYRDLPNIASTVFHTSVMASADHQKRMHGKVDIAFNPDISQIGILDWSAFDRLVQLGLEHGRQVLAQHGLHGSSHQDGPEF